ncbi:hypothetical protein [Kingella oralis]|uniref:hypothetical protein n=1 Tax=Kingella oralis TaxID=505 RepID=UPI002D80300A|nr:hypothetical protein [Kingella oralis]
MERRRLVAKRRIKRHRLQHRQAENTLCLVFRLPHPAKTTLRPQFPYSGSLKLPPHPIFR